MSICTCHIKDLVPESTCEAHPIKKCDECGKDFKSTWDEEICDECDMALYGDDDGE